MSCFQIPMGVCNKLKKPICNFWWGMENGKKKVHWRSWDWLSSPKYLGGMGFRDMAMFNQAMLGKQGWRLLTEPQSLCARVMKGRYFPNGDFWSARCPRYHHIPGIVLCMVKNSCSKVSCGELGTERPLKSLEIPGYRR